MNYYHAIYVCHNDWGVLEVFNTKKEVIEYAEKVVKEEKEMVAVGDYANRFEPIEIYPEK